MLKKNLTGTITEETQTLDLVVKYIKPTISNILNELKKTMDKKN